MKIITHYYDDVKHDTINCVPLFPVLNLWCEFEAHLTTKSFRSRDQSVRSRCSSHSAAQSHVAYSVQWSISKTIQHTPMTRCTYLQIFKKIHQCVFELQCENCNDGRTDRRTDGRTGGIATSPVPGLRRGWR